MCVCVCLYMRAYVRENTQPTKGVTVSYSHEGRRMCVCVRERGLGLWCRIHMYVANKWDTCIGLGVMGWLRFVGSIKL